VQAERSYERAAIEAAVTGSELVARKAMLLYPSVGEWEPSAPYSPGPGLPEPGIFSIVVTVAAMNLAVPKLLSGRLAGNLGDVANEKADPTRDCAKAQKS
jgi:hypothetical protein